MNRRFMAPALLIVLALTTVAGVSAQTTERHSGTVVAIDTGTGVLTLAEAGPSGVGAGKTAVTEQTFALTRTTVYVGFSRGPSRSAGDFIEVAVQATDVAIGSHATVECARQGPRLVALRVALTDPRSDARVTAPPPAPAPQPPAPAAAAMPRLPAVERTGISHPGNESPPQTEVVRPPSPAGGREPDPRAVIDWLLNPATR